MTLSRGRTALLLAPALLVVVVLFLGGLALGVAASLGYQPFLPRTPLTLDAYRELLTDVEVRRSLVLTVRTAVLATVLSSVLAVAGALLLRSTRRGRRFATFVFQATSTRSQITLVAPGRAYQCESAAIPYR